MKKEWNAPAILDLTIQATAHGHFKEGGHHGGHGKFDNGNKSDLCRCDGGMSPCSKHHQFDDDSDINEHLS